MLLAGITRRVGFFTKILICDKKRQMQLTKTSNLNDLQLMSSEEKKIDVIVIGGGPAGMSAAITCAELGIDAILLEREAELGGQLLWTYNVIENFPQFAAISGRELYEHFLKRVENAGVKYLTNAVVEHVDLEQKCVILQNGDRYTAKSIILATGVRRRLLNVPGEAEFYGRGILESGIKNKEQVRGKTVVIVGGGDAALENACILSEVAEKIVVVHRGDHFKAQNKFIESAKNSGNVEFIFKGRVTEIIGDKKVRAVKIENLASGSELNIDTDAVLIRIGIVPNTEFCGGQIELDNERYVITNNEFHTNVLAIFAAGDVASPKDLTLASAVSGGIESAKRTKI